MLCPVCEKEIKGDSWAFRRHFENQHSDGKKLDCPYCGKTYKKSGPLRKHVQNKHEEEEISENESEDNNDEEDSEDGDGVLPPHPFIEMEAIQADDREGASGMGQRRSKETVVR